MRKLFLSLILSLFVLFAYAEGISNYKELLAFAKAVNKEADLSQWQDSKGVVCLKADIDMKKGKKFPTIKMYDGKFDGCGYKLYNWKAKAPLFHELGSSAVLKNLTIDKSCSMEVKTQYNESDVYVSFFVNINKGHIVNCVNNGDINHTGEGATKAIYIGAIVAHNNNVVYKCKNAGKISSRINFTAQKKDMIIRMGGVIGANTGKIAAFSTISRCENTGEISYLGDYTAVNIAGIVGEASRATTKYCVNRGNVVAVGMPFANPKVKGAIRISGITAWANNDILCCDNFGLVSASGVHASVVAGICSIPNGTFNIVDCTNYGKVTCSADAYSNVGGLVGLASRNIHLVCGVNRGEVSFVNAQKPARVGGIAGTISLNKKTQGESFIRNSINYGKVINASTAKNALTGGIIASASGAVKGEIPMNVHLCNCINKGEVSNAGGRVDEIVGGSKLTKVRGTQYSDWATIAEPLPSGENIYGRVTDANGLPIAGVIMSDGFQSVTTDAKGKYAMKSDMSKVRFVTVSVPAEYEIQTYENRPQFFCRVARHTNGARANFVLKKRENPTDNFMLAMIGDPQTRGLRVDNSTERFRDDLLPDVAAFKEKSGKDMYAINLGDLLYNYMWAYDDYVDVVSTAKLPMFSVIGNHDYDQQTILETELGTPYFESYLAPLNYSFNIGKIHFVVVNSIDYTAPGNKHRYRTGMEDYTYKWLESDLKHISNETTIVICSHAPLFKWRTGFQDKSVNYKKYSALLSRYDNVYAWAGHTHQNYEYDYAKAPAKHKLLKNVKHIVVGRCIGQLRLNRELNVDGTPNGYVVAEVNGDKMEWYYKTLGHDRNHQMRVYTPTRTNSEYVKVHVWNYSTDTWSAIEWWENGVKVAEMEHAKGEQDPDYLKIYAEHQAQKLEKTARRYSKPSSKVPFLYRVKPTAGVRSGEVRVTDQFGVTYTQSVTW